MKFGSWAARRVFAGTWSSACLFLVLAPDARADEPRYPAPRVEPEIYTLVTLPTGPMGGFSQYLGGVGVGLRATVSPLPRGVLGDADDRFGIFGGLAAASIWGQAGSVPADANGRAPYTTYADDSTPSFVLFPFGLRWLLPLSRGVSVFLEPGGLAFVRLHSLPLRPGDLPAGVSPTGALGMQVFVSRRIAFTFRAGYPMLLTIGVSAAP